MGERRRLLEARLAEVEAERDALRVEMADLCHRGLHTADLGVEAMARLKRSRFLAAGWRRLAAVREDQRDTAEARARYLADELEASRGRSLPKGGP